MDDQVKDALRIAGALIDAGVPVFAAPPCPGESCPRPGHAAGGVEYDLPARWQMTVPSRVWLERWRPGWALAAVGGWAADFLDEDPRNGGEASVAELKAAGAWPTAFGVQETPSGGYHTLISPIGERKVTGLLPGLDYQGGARDARGQGVGRGFVWIAPTVRRSKNVADEGRLRPYVWLQEPDLDWLADFSRDEAGRSADPSVEGIRDRIVGWRAKRDEKAAARVQDNGSAPRTFTLEQMEHFVSGPTEALRTASIGSIEERANDLACVLSHFVPSMMTEEQAFDRLMGALGETAYDPMHPASRWEADKFHDVISGAGGRAPGDWYAVPAPVSAVEAVAAVELDGDEVTALLAEMLTAEQLAKREPPRHMIDGLLTFDSESWLIGEPGARKSFVALDMAAHVATGRPWQGRRVNRAWVVFIVAEGAGGSAARVKAWQARYGDMGGLIRFLPRPVQAAKLADWAVLVRACERLARGAAVDGAGLMVVLDTQARVTVGLKENDATDMGVFIEAVRAIREATGGCVLTIHHTGRKGGDARGSSAIDGAQTTELKVTKTHGLYGKLYTEKQKDIEELAPVPLKFEVVPLGQDFDGRDVSSLVLALADTWDAAEVDDETLASARGVAEASVTPFAGRAEPEPWTHARTNPDAKLQRWLLQALADTAENGIERSEWRKIVEEKTGKLTTTSWRKAFEKVTGPTFEGLVIKVHGAQRWTLDHVAKLSEMPESD